MPHSTITWRDRLRYRFENTLSKGAIAIIAWLGMNAWLQAKGFPLLPPEPGDQHLVARMLGGPPPTKFVQLEARVLAAFGDTV